ncbi:MAG: hypothetical protein WBG19_01210 [Thermoplasmata archaeon]
MAAPVESSPFPTAFVVVTFAASIAIGVAIAYFGIHGQIGGTIP